MRWVDVGTQVGFDPKKLGKLWNKLANTALHVKIPKKSSDEVRRYGEQQRTREAVIDALEEIERIDKSTLTSGGFGQVISFECSCGIINKRRHSLLQDRKIINCINPNCYESYTYIADTEEFHKRKFELTCKLCKETTFIPIRYMEKELKIGSFLRIPCTCGSESYIEWRLMQAQKPPVN